MSVIGRPTFPLRGRTQYLAVALVALLFGTLMAASPRPTTAGAAPAPADLAVTLTGPDKPVASGDVADTVLRGVNDGPGHPQVVVADLDLDGPADFVSVDPTNGGQCEVHGQSARCQWTQLDGPLFNADIKTKNTNITDVYVMRAAVHSNVDDPNPQNNTARTVITVGTVASAPISAAKKCVPTSTPGVATCYFVVQFSVPIPGPAVFIVSSGPATFTAAPTVTAFGCPGTVTIPSWSANSYNVAIAPPGCLTGATIVFTETVSYTSNGQICQKIFLPGTTLGASACAQLPTFTPKIIAHKQCTPLLGTTIATCVFKVKFVNGLPSGATINVSMTSVPAGANYTAVSATSVGCGLVTVPPPAPTNFVATVGPPGCSAGGTITFTEQLINAATGHTVTQTVTTSFGGTAVASATY